MLPGVKDTDLKKNIDERGYFAEILREDWTDLLGDVIATGSTASKTDVLTTTNRFYRFRLFPDDEDTRFLCAPAWRWAGRA